MFEPQRVPLDFLESILIDKKTINRGWNQARVV